MQNHDSLNYAQKVEKLSPEAIQRLENLDLEVNPENGDFWPFSASDKADVLLVAAGEKPAAMTYIWGEPYDVGDPPLKPRDSSAEYIDIVRGLGLHAFTDLEEMEALPNPARPEVARRITVRLLYIAKTEQELSKLVEASSKNDRAAIGQALGYPDTSVQAFVNGDKLPISQIDDVDPALKAFNFFILSPNNYKAELAVSARWAEAVRRASPVIYSAVTNEGVS